MRRMSMVPIATLSCRLLVSCFLLLFAAHSSVFAADSAYGVITEVRSPTVMVLTAGTIPYTVRLVAVEPPQDPALLRKAKQFVTALALGKNARFYLYQKENDQFVALVKAGDRQHEFKDVGAELVKAGLATASDNRFYKYGELARAQTDAARNRRGLWASR